MKNLTAIKGETDASHELRKGCKYVQYNVLRDMVSVSKGTCIERIGDGILIELPGFWNSFGWQAPRRWLIATDGKRELHSVNEAAPVTPYKHKKR